MICCLPFVATAVCLELTLYWLFRLVDWSSLCKSLLSVIDLAVVPSIYRVWMIQTHSIGGVSRLLSNAFTLIYVSSLCINEWLGEGFKPMVIDAENLLNVVQVMSLCFTIFVDLPDRRSVQFSIYVYPVYVYVCTSNARNSAIEYSHEGWKVLLWWYIKKNPKNYANLVQIESVLTSIRCYGVRTLCCSDGIIIIFIVWEKYWNKGTGCQLFGCH